MDYFERLKSWIKARIKRVTATTSKTAIATLSTAILILAVSVSVFKSARFFCWEHPGILIVVLAVAGEVICDWNRKKNLKERLKKFFGMLLVVGLLLEIAEAVGADKKVSSANLEAKQAEYEAGQANERAANTESNNLVLQKELQPRIITMEQITNFIFLTEKIPKFRVRVGIGETRDETFSYAWQIKQMLNQAGFLTPDSDTNFIAGIHADPTAFIIPANPAKMGGLPTWGDLWLVTDNTNNFTVFSSLSVEKTNGLVKVTIAANDTNNIYAAFVYALGQIGIKIDWRYKPDWVTPNHCEIYVLQKP